MTFGDINFSFVTTRFPYFWIEHLPEYFSTSSYVDNFIEEHPSGYAAAVIDMFDRVYTRHELRLSESISVPVCWCFK
jgi:hypothetical protein